MALQHSDIYLFNVPWTKGDGNLVLFKGTSTLSSREVQADAFLEYIFSTSNYSGSNYNIIKEGVLKLPVNSYAIQNYNYLMFKNDDLLRPGQDDIQYWYAYVDSVEWLSYNSCAVHYTLDAWQNFQHEVTFKKCFVERSHIPKSQDTAGKWLAPEPVSVTPQIERTLQSFDSLDWSPQWVLHSTSKYNDTTKKYEYSGTGTGGTLTAEYGTFVNSTNDIKSIVNQYGRKSASDIATEAGVESGNETWIDWINSIFAGSAGTEVYESVKATTSVADLQDHRNELIGLYAIPKWVKTSSTSATNDIHTEDINVSLNRSTLACGYTPRNKKMLTSLCKAYVIYTKNGFKTSMKPELFSNDTPTMRLFGSEMATDGYLLHIGDYGNISDSYFKMNYSCQSRLGYDANTGLDKTLNTLSATVGTIGAIGGLAGGIASENPLAIAYGANAVATSGVSMIDSIGQRGVNTGTSGNLISITGDRAIPYLVDVSPTQEECEIIDDYFDVNGYSINEIMQPNITSRSKWNFIKVKTLNAKISAPDEYAQVIKSNFENGCTIWHTSIAKVGDYSGTND